MNCNDIVIALGNLAEDKDPTVTKDSLLCLVNLSAEDEGAEILLKSVHIQIIKQFVRRMHFFKWPIVYLDSKFS